MNVRHDDDPLRPAAGILFGTLLSTLGWIALFAVWWLV